MVLTENRHKGVFMSEEEILEEEGTPAIFLRKVDVIIQNENQDPIIIQAN